MIEEATIFQQDRPDPINPVPTMSMPSFASIKPLSIGVLIDIGIVEAVSGLYLKESTSLFIHEETQGLKPES